MAWIPPRPFQEKAHVRLAVGNPPLWSTQSLRAELDQRPAVWAQSTWDGQDWGWAKVVESDWSEVSHFGRCTGKAELPPGGKAGHSTLLPCYGEQSRVRSPTSPPEEISLSEGDPKGRGREMGLPGGWCLPAYWLQRKIKQKTYAIIWWSKYKESGSSLIN